MTVNVIYAQEVRRLYSLFDQGVQMFKLTRQRIVGEELELACLLDRGAQILRI
jgi:hypothetical protein